MVCSVLAMHRVSPWCFNLSGLRPASVRDQLMRSTLIVRSLLDEGLILPKEPDRGLLVYGAGPAGINAAMEAAGFGVHVTVVEKSDTRPSPFQPDGTRSLFSVLSQCTCRKVNATEYDWPHEGWRLGQFLGSSLPQASPTPAQLQAAVWCQTWRLFEVYLNGKNGLGVVTLVDRRDAADFRVVHGPDAELTVSGPWSDGKLHRLSSRNFGALLSCVGLGRETVTVDGAPFSGPTFWSDADGIFPGMALPDGVTHAVISGGGDGAMQDLQRVATSYYGGELYQRFERQLEAEEKPDHQLRADLLAADERGRRAYCWAGTRQARLAVAASWHRSIERQVFAFFNRRWHTATFKRLAQGLLREQLLDDRLSITWVVREPTPGPAYVLNRFLVLLLLALSKHGTAQQRIVERDDCEIGDIAPANGLHACGAVQDCIGKTHTVKINQLRRSRVRLQSLSADLILIRHGLEPAPPVLNGPAPVTDQILPLSLS